LIADDVRITPTAAVCSSCPDDREALSLDTDTAVPIDIKA
jgi:hypothetical protein